MHGHKRDVTAAFLQGSDTELERAVLAEPVQKLSEKHKLQPWECVWLRKAVCGLVKHGGRRSMRSWLTSPGLLLLQNYVFEGS